MVRSGSKKKKEIMRRTSEFVKDTIFFGQSHPDRLRRRFKPSGKTIKNLVASVQFETRHSKFDQENIAANMEEWKKWANVMFTPKGNQMKTDDIITSLENKITEDDNEDDDEEDIDYGTVDLNLHLNLHVEKKLCFVYQSNNMQNLYRKYGKHLVLLDATHKVCKYALPLFFLVVQTNVNFQLAAVIVTEDEDSKLLLKALQKIHEWNPDIIPKYGMVDFDCGEILALETIFPGILIFLCDFHREQAWSRWVNKKENHVFMFCDEVKCRLRRIANALTVDDCHHSVNEMKSWERYHGKLASWFEGTWPPEIRRWCLAYRPDDLFRCNTNNGTERLNESLKYEELDGYKGCSLSELINILIDSFVPNLYEKYINLNVKYTDGYKGYADFVPAYMVNRPGPLVEDMLQKRNQVTSLMIDSVVSVADLPKIFTVQSASPNSSEIKTYHVNFGDGNTICSCECESFKRNRTLCKHFFCVFESMYNVGFNDISVLYRNHPYTNIDYDVIQITQSVQFGEERDSAIHVDESGLDSPSTSQIDFNVDQSALLPPRRKNKVTIKKQSVLSNLKLLTEKNTQFERCF